MVNERVAFFGSAKNAWLSDTAGQALGAAFVLSGVVGVVIGVGNEPNGFVRFMFQVTAVSVAAVLLLGTLRMTGMRILFDRQSQPDERRKSTQRALYWLNGGMVFAVTPGMAAFALAVAVLVFEATSTTS